MGYYNPPNILLKSEAVAVNFCRISFKINFKSNTLPNAEPITAVFFNSPNIIVADGWDVELTYAKSSNTLPVTALNTESLMLLVRPSI